jgi:SAM-dependent methyltransferase
MNEAAYMRLDGFCPACNQDTTFVAENAWFRDTLRCQHCDSLPRERAVMLVLRDYSDHWQELRIHESSPADRGGSKVMKENCKNYVASHYLPGEKWGSVKGGLRVENLESQTFRNEEFDVVITQDVFEHLNRPNLAAAEIARTLKVGGVHIFSAPTHKEELRSHRRSVVFEDGSVDFLTYPPEYHGNPTDPAAGSLVTWRYGYDFYELLRAWSGCDVEVRRFHDHRYGIIGEFTEIYIMKKR